MATLKNHPGHWMRDDAAASLARWEADHGIIGVNSAGRTVAEQQHLINRWNQGGTYNRPPYLYEPKRPASASSHVYDGGIAFDTSEYVRFRRTSAAYGWWQPYDWDVVHFEYDPKRDKHRNRPASGGSTKPSTPTTPDQSEEDEMRNCGVYYERSKNTWVYLIFNTGSGWYHEFSNGANAGAMPSAYNNALATALDTKNWAKVTPGHAAVIKQALAAVQRTAVTGSLSVDIDA